MDRIAMDFTVIDDETEATEAEGASGKSTTLAAASAGLKAVVCGMADADHNSVKMSHATTLRPALLMPKIKRVHLVITC
ncbi:MAG: hypothetical protein ACXVZI_03360 [Terriglobales bacterium]